MARSYASAVLDSTPEVEAPTIVEAAEVEDTTDIAVRQFSSEVAFEREDLSFPLLRLAQGLSAEVAEGEAKIGDWLLSGYDPLKGEVTVVVLRAGKSREYRNANERTEILCQSADGKTGVGTPGGVCETCPLQQWTPGGANGKNNPPLCSQQYNYLVYSVEHEAYATLTLKRTGIEAGKQINSFLATRGFGVGLVLRTETKKTPKGTFAIVRPRLTTKIDPELVAQALETVAGAV